MADRPILFSAPMVRAILDGRKTQTRRIIKPGDALVTGGADEVVRYRAGDRLWVREAHRLVDCECDTCRVPSYVWFDATDDGYRGASQNRLRPSIHMPRWASRLTLIVEGVKIERLNDISDEDAIAEGIAPGIAPAHSFSGLWRSINGPGSWEANPWVVALTFRTIKANIDTPEAKIAA